MPEHEGAAVRTSQEPFDQVPCWLRELGLHAYTTYAALVSYERRGCFPSVAALSVRAMISERSVRSALRALEVAGAIRTEQSKGRATSTYHLLGHQRNPAAGAALPPPTRQEVPVPTRQEVPPMSDEGLTSQSEGPNGPSRLRDSRSARDEPGAHPDADAICERLAAHVAEVLERPAPPITKGWRREARLMLDGPGKAEPEWSREQLEHVIGWLSGPTRDAQFWRSNVLSMDALRRQMPRLAAAVKREHAARVAGGGASRPVQTHADLAAMADRLEARERAAS